MRKFMRGGSWFFCLALLSMIAACDKSTEMLNVGTARFCVPLSNLIEVPTWVPTDMPSTGFAFRAPASRASTNKSDSMKDSLDVTGTVSERERFSGWSHPKPDHFYRRIAENTNAVLDSSAIMGALVVYENKARKRWFIWNVAKRQSFEHFRITDEDELVAVCEAGAADASAAGTVRALPVCQRVAIGRDISVFYSLPFSERKIDVIKAMDSVVLDLVNQWRCK